MPKFSYRMLRGVVLFAAAGILLFAGGYEPAKIRLGGEAPYLVRQFVGSPNQGQADGAAFGRFWEVW